MLAPLGCGPLPPHLHRHLVRPPIHQQACAVHLGDGARGQGAGLEGQEQVFQGGAQGRLHDATGLREWAEVGDWVGWGGALQGGGGRALAGAGRSCQELRWPLGGRVQRGLGKRGACSRGRANVRAGAAGAACLCLAVHGGAVVQFGQHAAEVLRSRGREEGGGRGWRSGAEAAGRVHH